MNRAIKWLRSLVPSLRRRDEHSDALDSLHAKLLFLEDLRERILAGEAPVKTNRIDAANALMEQIVKGRELLRQGERIA